MELDRVEVELPSAEVGEGFVYLYDLLSHLTSSRQLFSHKIRVLVQLSRETDKGLFTKSEIEALFPSYPSKTLESILNSLIDGAWLEREEGTLSYGFTKAGLLFTRFLPFLYRGDELDEMAFQMALAQMFDAAERMDLGLSSLEFLRDQALHAIQRHIQHIRTALVSKNEERIIEAQQKMNVFLQDIDEFVIRLKQLNHEKRRHQLDINESDRHPLSFLLNLKGSILELFDERKKQMQQSTFIGGGLFSKADLDRFLCVSSFEELQGLLDGVAYVPSNAKWVDEDDIVRALNIFLSRKKPVKTRTFSPRVFGGKEENITPSSRSYVSQVEATLKELFQTEKETVLSQFLLSAQTKEEVLMSLATVCFLDGKRSFSLGKHVEGFSLDTLLEYEEFEDQILRVLSKGRIIRRDSNE